jgi:hypothetical protein
MWMDAEVALTHLDETHNVEDGVRRQLVQQKAVYKEDPTKKLVGRE